VETGCKVNKKNGSASSLKGWWKFVGQKRNPLNTKDTKELHKDHKELNYKV